MGEHQGTYNNKQHNRVGGVSIAILLNMYNHNNSNHKRQFKANTVQSGAHEESVSESSTPDLHQKNKLFR